MPIAIAILGRERKISTLARKIFKLEDITDGKLRRRAEAALIRANPRLATPDGFRAGASIVVPTVSGLETTENVTTANTLKQGLGSETALRLQEAASRVEDKFASASNRRRRTLEHIGDSEFVKEARKALPQSLEFINKSLERLKQEEEEAVVAAEKFQSAFKQAIEGVNALDGLMNRRKPQ